MYDIIIISKENEHKRTEASAIVGADAHSFFAPIRGNYMKKVCSYCGKIHDKGYICSHKPQYSGKFDKFRNSGAWQRKREQIYERDLYCCKVCALTFFDGIPDFDISVHHIIPLSEDYERRLDNDNLITVCGKHHKQAERGEISRDHLRSLIPPEGGQDFL